MDEIKLNIYEKDMKIIKRTETAVCSKVSFGIVRKFFKLFKAENINATDEIINIVANMWDEVTEILNNFFPHITEDEWDYIAIDELVSVIIKIIKWQVDQLRIIPTSKN